MIPARLLAAPEPERRERPRAHPHRGAAARRSMWLRILATASVPFVLVMVYVAMVTRVTSLSYSYANERAALRRVSAQHTQLDDELARLRSPQRLAALARKLGMKSPDDELVVRFEPPRTVAGRNPFARGAAFISEAAGSILRLR